MVTGLLHLLYPKRCPICDRIVYTPLMSREYPICSTCQDRVEYASEPSCKKCGKPLTDERREFCQDCTRHNHLFDQGKALWVYKGCVKESIYRLKYGNRREYALSYAQELARRYGSWIRRRKIEVLVPIPLHRKRRRQRGYNQAELIARELGRILELPVDARALMRHHNTKPQKELDDKERRSNLKEAFGASETPWRRVLLVDDIYTTGSTMDGASGALRKAGVTEIYFLSVSIGRGF